VGKIHPCKCTTPAHATRPRAEVKPNILVDVPTEDEDAMMQLKTKRRIRGKKRNRPSSSNDSAVHALTVRDT